MLTLAEKDRNATMRALIGTAVLGLVPLPSPAIPGDRWCDGGRPGRSPSSVGRLHALLDRARGDGGTIDRDDAVLGAERAALGRRAAS
jgi:hypothetical protein